MRTALDTPEGILDTTLFLSLTRLEARGDRIADLSGIDRLKRLEVLDLADNQIRDLSPLSGLTELTFLELSDNQIEDLRPLAGLINLEILGLEANAVQDLSPLLGLNRLQSLELTGNPLSEASLHQVIPDLKARGVEVVFQEYSSPPSPVYPACDIAYAGQAGPHSRWSEIFLRNTDGSPPRRLTDHPARYSDFCWSPDGMRLAFVADRELENSFHLYVLDVERSEVTKLAEADGRSLAWSPDGMRIAFVRSFRLSSQNLYYSEIFSVDAGNREWMDLTQIGRNYTFHETPSWSPDGMRLAFLRRRVSPGTFETRESNICITDASGRSLREVDFSGTIAAGPVWSPDGMRIAFVGEAGGMWDIYVVDASGGVPENLTHDPAVEFSLAWAPGRRIAFGAAADPASPPECYVVDADGGSRIQVTHFGTYDVLPYPVWSPDGTRIAVVYDRDIYVVDAEGRELLNLTHHDPPVQGLAYAWRPG